MSRDLSAGVQPQLPTVDAAQTGGVQASGKPERKKALAYLNVRIQSKQGLKQFSEKGYGLALEDLPISQALLKKIAGMTQEQVQAYLVSVLQFTVVIPNDTPVDPDDLL